jgi:hypothetical protein
MKSIYLLLPCLLCLLFSACRLPDKWVTGVYINGAGDSLRIKTNYAFRAEMADPDTVEKRQMKYTSGRWHQEKGKLYLTVATESMSQYWGCVPMKVSIRHLKRPVECSEGNGKQMHFKKIHIKKPKPFDGKPRKEKKGKKEENP